MKNIFEIMKEYGLEVPPEKKKDFEKAVLENYKTVSDYDAQKEKLDAATEVAKANDKTIEELKKEIEGFKGVDVSALNAKIKELEDSKKQLESDYNTKLADRDFNDALKESITAAKGKNAKAITALLDVDVLKASKNQKEDIATALKALSEAEDSKMLFGEPDPEVTGEGDLIGKVNKTSGDAADAQLRAVMGLPPLKEGGNN